MSRTAEEQANLDFVLRTSLGMTEIIKKQRGFS